MSTRKPSPHDRALRPRPEDLETRQLLATVLRGIDVDGDTYSLRMQGPGDVRVVNQPGADGQPIPLGTAGRDRSDHRRRHQRPAQHAGGPRPAGPRRRRQGLLQDAGGAGQSVAATSPPAMACWRSTCPASGWATRRPRAPPAAGRRRPRSRSPTASSRCGSAASMPPGGRPRARLPAGTQDDTIPITLGLPRSGGTRIVVDQVISSTQTDGRDRQPAGRGRATWRALQRLREAEPLPGRLDRGGSRQPQRPIPRRRGDRGHVLPRPEHGDHRPDRRRPRRGGCHQLLGPDQRQPGQLLHRRRDQERLPPDPDRLAQPALRQGPGHRHHQHALDRAPGGQSRGAELLDHRRPRARPAPLRRRRGQQHLPLGLSPEPGLGPHLADRSSRTRAPSRAAT